MAAYEDCLTRIREILDPLAKQGHIIQEDTELVAELGLSSLQVMELIERLEDDFDISIPLNILPEVRSVRDLGVQLEQLTNSQQ
ncbi:MAG: acyl carrier protein [Gammaproteobacteria bacterium]